MAWYENFTSKQMPVLTGVVIVVGAIVLTKLVRWLIHESFARASEKIKVDATRYRFFKNAVSLIIWIIAVGALVSLIPGLKSLAVTLFAGAGIFMAIVGFAAQEAFSNIIGGIFIVMFRPFRVGDIIKVGERDYGEVEDITLRHTVILSFQNKRIIIPNAVISSETIVNDSIGDSRVCKWIEVGISYDSSIDKAMKIMEEVALNHKSCIDFRTQKEKDAGEPQVLVRVIRFGDFSVDLRAYVWAEDAATSFQMHSDINRELKRRFDEEGIEIPFPYRTVVYKNDLPKNAG